jgi:hypothetical protein
MRSAAVMICCAALAHGALSAQEQRPESTVPESDDDLPVITHVPMPTSSLIASGVIGGAIGVVAGTVAIGLPLAYAMEPTDDGLSTPGFIIGFQLGQALGIASGVHRGNDRQGDFTKAVILSTAVGAIGTALLWTGDFDAAFESRRSQVILVAVPVTQLITSIYSARN